MKLLPAAAPLTWNPKRCEKCKVAAAVWKLGGPWVSTPLPQSTMTHCDACFYQAIRDYHEPVGCGREGIIVEALEELARESTKLFPAIPDAPPIEWSPAMCERCKSRPATVCPGVEMAANLTHLEARGCDRCMTVCGDCCSVYLCFEADLVNALWQLHLTADAPGA